MVHGGGLDQTCFHVAQSFGHWPRKFCFCYCRKEKSRVRVAAGRASSWQSTSFCSPWLPGPAMAAITAQLCSPVLAHHRFYSCRQLNMGAACAGEERRDVLFAWQQAEMFLVGIRGRCFVQKTPTFTWACLARGGVWGAEDMEFVWGHFSSMWVLEEDDVGGVCSMGYEPLHCLALPQNGFPGLTEVFEMNSALISIKIDRHNTKHLCCW